MSEAVLPRQELDLGRVIQETIGVIQRNFGPFAILALILSGIPAAVINVVAPGRGAMTAADLSGGHVYGAVLGGLVAWVFGTILQATVIYGAVMDLNSRRPSIVDSLRIGLNAFLPLMALAILMAIAVFCGLILLIVPGILLAVAWAVVVPVYVIERPPLMDSFGRSAALTRGNRWRIFGLAVLVIVVVIVIEIVFGVIGAMTGFLTMGGLPIVTRILVLPVASALSALVGAAGSAALYFELRRVHDGVEPQAMTAVFD